MSLYSFVAAATLLSASLAAHADTISQTFTGAMTEDGLNEYVNYPTDFNPALGTLNSITLSSSGTFTASTVNYDFVSVQNSVFGPIFVHTVDQPRNPTIAGGSFAYTDTTTNPSSLFDAQQANNEGIELNLNGPFLASSNVTEVLTYNYTPAPPPMAVTPEPSSIFLLGTGLLGALGIARKRFA